VLDAIDRVALRVLVRRLGLLRALRAGVAVQWRTARGEPFADLPPAEGFAETGSRAQAGPAIVLYRVLAQRHDPSVALQITGEVIEEAALVFLRQSLGFIERDEVTGLDDDARRRFAEERAARFPNATLTFDEIGPERVRFTVHRCRLVELVHHAGHPELAPLFCRGDARYFGEVQPGVRLTRPGTLAQGDPSCPFTLAWEEE